MKGKESDGNSGLAFSFTWYLVVTQSMTWYRGMESMGKVEERKSSPLSLQKDPSL